MTNESRRLGFVAREVLRELVARHDIVQALQRCYEVTGNPRDLLRASAMHDRMWRECAGNWTTISGNVSPWWRQKVRLAAESIGWEVTLRVRGVRLYRGLKAKP